jgi:hypothetical protein
MEPFIRRDVASLKPMPGWTAFWKPDYEKNGTGTGIQLYDLQLDKTGNGAVVLCLVGGTHSENIGGAPHSVWMGSHVRDTWIKSPARWKRRMREKLTVNERMVDGKPAS